MAMTRNHDLKTNDPNMAPNQTAMQRQRLLFLLRRGIDKAVPLLFRVIYRHINDVRKHELSMSRKYTLKVCSSIR